MFFIQYCLESALQSLSAIDEKNALPPPSIIVFATVKNSKTSSLFEFARESVALFCTGLTYNIINMEIYGILRGLISVETHCSPLRSMETQGNP